MVLKLVFYDKTKNNAEWWDRLFDRIGKVQDRRWIISGGGKFGEPQAEFTFMLEDGSKISDQQIVNEIVWCFMIEQINTESFYLDGKEITELLKNR